MKKKDITKLLRGREIVDAYRAEHAKGGADLSAKLSEDIKALGFASIDDFFDLNRKMNLIAFMECYILEQKTTKCSEGKCPNHKCGVIKYHNENFCASHVIPEVERSMLITGKGREKIPAFYGITHLRLLMIFNRMGVQIPDYKVDTIDPLCPPDIGFYLRKVEEPLYDWTWC